MKKSELRKLIKKEMTILKARKELQNYIRIYGDGEIYVRCFTCGDDGVLSTDLEVELYDGYDWHTIVLATIEVPDTKDLEENKYWKLVDDSCEVFKTLKKNMIAELEKYGYEISNTEDYHI